MADNHENHKQAASEPEFVPPEDAELKKSEPLNDAKTERAVDDIEKKDADELLVAEDAKHIDTPKRPWFKRLFGQKKVWIPLLIIVILAILAAVPLTRYKLAGLVWKQTYAVQVTDSHTGKPVSDVRVSLDGQTSLTNTQGKASLKIKVGHGKLTFSKKYYATKTASVLVGLRAAGAHAYKLQATGRQVPLTVVNKVSGQPVDGVEISAAGTTAKTDKDGKVTMVLPADKSSVKASISGSGFNTAAANIDITPAAIPANSFQITPAGTVYFLSNASGKIDVVSTNLDGTNRQTVLAGTGNEDPNDTVLLASHDWKYLALLSRRAGGQYPALYLINTSNDQLTTMDEGSASFTPIGWAGHYFIYQVDRANVQDWQPNQSALKSFDADTGKITVLDQTSASGNSIAYASQDFGYDDTYIVNGGSQIVYIKEWNDNGTGLTGKQDQILSIAPDGSSKQVLKTITPTEGSYQNLNSVAITPDNINFQLQTYDEDGSSNIYYDYTNSTVTQTNTITDDSFQQAQQNYATYLLSPSGNQTFWSEPRDGKNTLFVGDANGDNGKQIAALNDYTPYGWYTDSYVLVEKGGNELYAMAASGGKALKISDYDTPSQDFNGYGGQ